LNGVREPGNPSFSIVPSRCIPFFFLLYSVRMKYVSFFLVDRKDK